MHGCESLHIESVPVKEVFEGETAWEGTVEVFELVGHPKANRAYVWTYRQGDQDNRRVGNPAGGIRHRPQCKPRLRREAREMTVNRDWAACWRLGDSGAPP